MGVSCPGPTGKQEEEARPSLSECLCPHQEGWLGTQPTPVDRLGKVFTVKYFLQHYSILPFGDQLGAQMTSQEKVVQKKSVKLGGFIFFTFPKGKKH